MDTNTFTHSLNFTMTYWGGEGHDPRRVYHRGNFASVKSQSQQDPNTVHSREKQGEEVIQRDHLLDESLAPSA